MPPVLFVVNSECLTYYCSAMEQCSLMHAKGVTAWYADVHFKQGLLLHFLRQRRDQ